MPRRISKWDTFSQTLPFYNFDFATWFKAFEFEPVRDFKGYSFDLVFQYTYVGEELWQHGGVQVLYKDRLHVVGTSREAEWKPIQRVMRSRPSLQGSEEVEVNETVSTGVLFIPRPPDLRKEPPREEFAKGDDTHETAQACDRICNVRADKLAPESVAFWKALKDVHHRSRHASAVPNLPFTSGDFTFDGCPKPLLPMLKDLARFPRPLITWDLFADAPPTEFQPRRAPSSDDAGLPALDMQAEESATLRDPRRVNHITHAGYTDAAASKDATDMRLEDWMESFPGRAEKVEGGKLYIVRLGEQDGELKLGLVQADGNLKASGGDSCMKALWYRRSGVDPTKCNNKSNFAWPKNPAFEPYKDRNGRITNELPVESFLLEVEDADFTEAGLAHKWDAPKFTQVFLRKLQMLATKYDNLRGIDPAGGGSSSGTSVQSGTRKTVEGANGKAANGKLPEAVVKPGTGRASKRVKTD